MTSIAVKSDAHLLCTLAGVLADLQPSCMRLLRAAAALKPRRQPQARPAAPKRPLRFSLGSARVVVEDTVIEHASQLSIPMQFRRDGVAKVWFTERLRVGRIIAQATPGARATALVVSDVALVYLERAYETNDQGPMHVHEGSDPEERTMSNAQGGSWTSLRDNLASQWNSGPVASPGVTSSKPQTDGEAQRVLTMLAVADATLQLHSYGPEARPGVFKRSPARKGVLSRSQRLPSDAQVVIPPLACGWQLEGPGSSPGGSSSDARPAKLLRSTSSGSPASISREVSEPVARGANASPSKAAGKEFEEQQHQQGPLIRISGQISGLQSVFEADVAFALCQVAADGMAAANVLSCAVIASSDVASTPAKQPGARAARPALDPQINPIQHGAQEVPETQTSSKPKRKAHINPELLARLRIDVQLVDCLASANLGDGLVWGFSLGRARAALATQSATLGDVSIMLNGKSLLGAGAVVVTVVLPGTPFASPTHNFWPQTFESRSAEGFSSFRSQKDGAGEAQHTRRSTDPRADSLYDEHGSISAALSLHSIISPRSAADSCEWHDESNVMSADGAASWRMTSSANVSFNSETHDYLLHDPVGHHGKKSDFISESKLVNQ